MAIVIAIAVGAAWAAIAGVLKVTRGVSEVISTIMLNAIAVSLTAYLLRQWGGTVGNSIQTKPLPKDSWVPGLPLIPGAPNEVLGAGARRGGRRGRLRRAAEPLALRVRAARHRRLRDRRGGQRDRRTPDGGDLDGASPAASRPWSGCRCCSATPTPTAPRSSPVSASPASRSPCWAATTRSGIAFGSLLFAFLVEQSSLLEINAGVSNDIVSITQGVLVLSVVIAYEIVRRYTQAAASSASVAEQLAPRDTEAKATA